MNLQQRNALIASAVSQIFLAIGIICLSVSQVLTGSELDELKKHPTYHCDGSTTMGYAVPGTPEAAACWIEGAKK